MIYKAPGVLESDKNHLTNQMLSDLKQMIAFVKLSGTQGSTALDICKIFLNLPRQS